MQIVSWNCKGLGNPLKAEVVKDLLKMETTDILLLQEKKIKEDSLLSLSQAKWKKNSGKVVSARGTLGGLSTLWSEVMSQLKISFATQHWIYTDLLHLPSKISLALFSLYVPVNFLEKKDCWNSFLDFLEIYAPQNIILAVDLNITLDPHEKKGGVRGKGPFHATVESLILEWDLLDHKPKKGHYT